jgi:O-antigen/teichoic acid export membrane protein
MIIVIPLISFNTDIYGIYVLCISISSFLQYADLGFLSAGQKYASEYFAINDIKNEIRMLGFIHFIMFVFLIICTCFILFFSLQPNIIIQKLDGNSKELASSLFFILGVTSPIILLQRYAQSVFTIRIRDDIYQKIDLIANLLKIICIFLFKEGNSVDLISYFIFIQILNLLTVLVSLGIIKYKYKYQLKLVVNSFKFDLNMYEKTKFLAFSSIISTVSWIIFFQFDSFIISKLFGISSVAIYAIPFFLLTFINNLYNTIYYPFLFRFNYFIVLKSYDKLYEFINKIFDLTFPIFIIPTTILILLMKSLIISWVGFDYIDSVLIGQILMTSLFFIFINMPYTYLLISLEKTRILNINSLILPSVFIIIIFVLKNSSSFFAVAIAKTTAFLISSLFLYLSFKVDKFSFFKLIYKRILSILFSLVTIILLYFVFNSYLHIETNSAISVIKTILFGIVLASISLVVYLLFSRDLFLFGKNILSSALSNTKKIDLNDTL